MSTDLISLFPPLLVWIVLAVCFFGFVGSRLGEASEGFAKAFGPLGKYWRRKIEKETHDRLQAFQREAKEAVNTELGVVRKAEYASLKAELISVLDRVAEMERTESVNTAYLIADAEWHRETELALAEQGLLRPPLPPRRPYRDFAEEYRRSRGWNK